LHVQEVLGCFGKNGPFVHRLVITGVAVGSGVMFFVFADDFGLVEGETAFRALPATRSFNFD